MRKTKRAVRSLKQDFNRRYAENRPVNFSQVGFLCRFSFLRKAVKMHAERAVPAGTKFPIGKFQSFLPYFLYFTKSRKKLLLGRAKSCRWQVFVRRRPPKQGELRTDVSKATMFQGDRGLRPSGLPGTIQSSVGEDFSKVFRRHKPNPVFRTKRRRKGFESVRRSGVTA